MNSYEEQVASYAINRYLKAWKIPEEKKYNLKPLVNKNKIKREVGEVWFENGKWYKQEEGFKIEFSFKGNENDSKIFVRCNHCNTTFINNLKNRNNILSIQDHDCCIKCYAKKETELILSKDKNFIKSGIINEETIVLKDSFGKPVGTLKELKHLYTEEEYNKILNDLKKANILK